jgi:hypothetical protein
MEESVVTGGAVPAVSAWSGDDDNATDAAAQIRRFRRDISLSSWFTFMTRLIFA